MKHLCWILLFAFHFSEAAMSVKIGPQHNYVHVDFDNPRPLEGFLTGVTALGEYQCGCLAALVNYEGYWSTNCIWGNPCQQSSVSEHLVYGACKLSYFPCSNLCASPYIGFGYNVFNNTQDPCRANLTYHFKKWIVPVGLTLCYSCSPSLAIGVQAEFRPDVRSRIEVINRCFDSKKEWAYRVQVPLVYSEKCFSLKLIPFYDWNRFGKTTENLPKISQLTRWDLGVRLLAGYYF